MVNFLIHRPIAVLMATLSLIILGILASFSIPVSLMPEIDIPEITVQVDGRGRSARELEDVIVRPLRLQLAQLGHLEEIESRTSNGSSVIRLKLNHGTSIHYAFIEANEKVDRAMMNLPKNLERPRVIKASGADIPVFYLDLTLKNGMSVSENGEISMQFLDFSRFVDQVIRKRIEQMSEVALVDVSGLVRSEIIIVPNEQKLIALGLDLSDIEMAIENENIEIGSILIKDSQYQYNLRLGASLSSLDDLGNLYIKKNSRIYQLKELVKLRERPQQRSGLILSNGKEAITLAIIKQADARIGNLEDALKLSISHMEKDYPRIGFTIMRDQTKLLNLAIGNLSQSLIWGLLLAFIVMFLFLKDFRSPILICISVPISLVLCLLLFYMSGISINIISLSGLILGIGLMIDNAIIVIDNIGQHRVRGHSLSKACVNGANEVFRPLLTSVLTTCSVFIPLIFLSGVSGALFYDQAMAVSIGLFVSLVVSMIFLPMLYRLIHLKKSRIRKGLNQSVVKFAPWDYNALYKKGFRFMMRRQSIAITIFISLTFCAIGLFMWLPKRQMPELTNVEALIALDWNTQINVEENKRRVLDLLQPIDDSLDEYNLQIGRQQFILNKEANTFASKTILYIRAKSEVQLEAIKVHIDHYLRKSYPEALHEYGEVDNIFNIIFSNNEPSLVARIRSVNNVGHKQNIQLMELWNVFKEDLRGKVSLPPIPWENNVVLQADSEKLMVYGIEKDKLESTLKKALNEMQVLTLIQGRNSIPVKLGSGVNNVREVLSKGMIRTKDSSNYYHLKNFIRETNTQDLKTIVAGRAGEYYPLALEVPPGQESLIMDQIRKIVGQNNYFDVYFTGNIFENNKLMLEMAMVLGITLLLLYFILAAQFESLTLPFIVLLEIPMALAGAFTLLAFFGMGIDLMSMIGIVVMSGIIINDSILKIDTIIQLQRQGYSLIYSILVAGERRLKPILMTSLTTILALLPILFIGGLGGELQTPLALTLIGGMLVGTLVSLYFIPLFYYHLSKNKKYV